MSSIIWLGLCAGNFISMLFIPDLEIPRVLERCFFQGIAVLAMAVFIPKKSY